MTAATSPSSTSGEAIDVVGDWSPGDSRCWSPTWTGASRIVQVAKKGRGWR